MARHVEGMRIARAELIITSCGELCFGGPGSVCKEDLWLCGRLAGEFQAFDFIQCGQATAGM